MSRMDDVGRFASSFLEAILRRVRGEPRSGHWPFKFAVLRGFLDRTADDIIDWPIGKVRAVHDNMVERRGFDLPVVRETDEIAGVDVEWFYPCVREVRDDGLIVYLHGGAYLFGSTRSHAELIGRLSLDARMPILGINYRLAPEHELEEAREDVISVWSALVVGDWDPEALTVAGDSAGGGLSVSTAVELRKRGMAMPAALGLISPWVDLSCTSASYLENEFFDYGTRHHIRKWRDHVVGDRDPQEPIFSPIYGDLSGLPPTLVHYGGGELLADDCRRFAARLEEAGVEVEAREWPDMVHAFHVFYKYLPPARDGIRELAAFLVDRAEVAGGNE